MRVCGAIVTLRCSYFARIGACCDLNDVGGAPAKLDSSRRIDSIIRVLEHYEKLTITPFTLFGVALTQSIVTLV
jgi:hypothetical protein